MDLSKFESGAAAGAPSAPASPSTGFPTNGDPGAPTVPTTPGEYWFYQIQEEMRNLIEDEAGLTPNHESLTQLGDAINAIIAANTDSVPVGAEMFFPVDTPPAGWLEEDGSELSMTTYEDLYDFLSGDYGLNAGETFTATNASNLINDAAHGLADNTIVELSNSGGALPTGLTAGTKYFIVNADVNDFQVSLTEGGAAVTFSDDGTGTHSYHTDFKLPDAQGEFLRAWDHGAGNDPDAASRTDRGDGTAGDNVGTKQEDELGSHLHNYSRARLLGDTTNAGSGSDEGSGYTTEQTQLAGGNETRPRNTNRLFCIKY